MSDIWFHRPTADALNKLHRNTACESLGITIVDVGDDYLTGEMPVDERTIQPFKLLHGGASVLLAETLASAGAMCTVDREKFLCVGTTITSNHIRAAAHGPVRGTAKPVHLGHTSQVWEIDIVAPDGRPVCLTRMTASIVELERFKPPS